MTNINSFDDLYKVIQERINKRPEGSYVASLVKGGKNRISQKVREETMELIVEVAKDKLDKKALTNEATDLLFHLWVLLAFFNVSPQDLLDELHERHRKKDTK
ncbi:MAG: phosphoribosyl-ATP diphosphatase [Candidatus Gottesmanbacteria bacterium]